MAYSTIDKSSSFMSTKLYTGNGSTQSITGVGFQPDFVWIKPRDNTGWQRVFDSTRGALNVIYPNDTYQNDVTSGSLTAFDSDGFTVGTNAGSNENTEPFVSWNLKAGTTSGLTGGTITPSSYSFNTTSKFGIYKRTGTASAGTITHGLGGVPKMIISKNLTDAANWRVYHTSIGSGNGINLNESAGDYSDANLWNGTDPTDTLYSIGSSNDTNKSGSDFIDYVFCDVSGFSSIGKYAGNGNADGTFVYTGFRPSFILLKRWNATADWMLFDNKRLGYNVDNNNLNPNLNGAEGTTDYLNILSNGFKLSTSDSLVNHSGGFFLYAAFGQSIVGSNGVVGTAR